MACPIITDSKEDFVANISSEATRDEESFEENPDVLLSLLSYWPIFYSMSPFPKHYLKIMCLEDDKFEPLH